MKTPRTIWLRLRPLRRREVKQEIDEELRFHIEQRTAENIAVGMSPEEAAREVRKRFGNVQSIREECRDVSGASFGETVLQDIRFGLRMLRKNPSFTAVEALTIALGIGCATNGGISPDGVTRQDKPVSNQSVGSDESYKFHFFFSDYKGDYLGLTRPGTTPERFAPGFISLDGRHDHGLVFSPSGKQAVFMTASLDWKDNRLCYLRQIEGRWTKPVELEFSRKDWCLNPIFTADEKRLIFSKVIGKDQTKYYYCDLTPEGYSAPHLLNTPLNDFTSGFSYYSDQRGNVYFCAVRPGGCGGTDLYVLAPGSGNDSVTPITELNSPLDDDSPFLSPDEKHLVFNRQTKDPQGKVRHDVMFSYRTPAGQWSPPVNYGRHIGAPGRNWRPVITADGKYLFFGMEGEKGFDVYWVSTRVIEQLEPTKESHL